MPEQNVKSTRAFVTKNPNRVNRLINQATIKTGEKELQVSAQWDTGATISCVSERVVKVLALCSTGMTTIQTPSGTSDVPTYLIDILLPNNVFVKDVQVCKAEIGSQGIGLLLGMDIIGLGEFAVSNFNNRTFFSFRVPSLRDADLTKEVRLNSIIGEPHGKGKRKRKK